MDKSIKENFESMLELQNKIKKIQRALKNNIQPTPEEINSATKAINKIEKLAKETLRLSNSDTQKENLEEILLLNKEIHEIIKQVILKNPSEE